jgi:D-alanyl-D-alanine carboxypeptidase
VPLINKLFRSLLALSIVILAALPAGALSRAFAESLLLIEADTGKVLYSENATQPWYPASVTKLMTAYVTLRAVKENRLSLDSLLTVSPNAAAAAPSKMGFKAGTQVTIDNALKMIMVKSANDMAVVLAEGVSGSVENFSNDMNKAARQLGMTQSRFVNPNGLPADEQVTSARDLAILARALVRELPEYDRYWHIPAIKFGKRVMRNYNTLIDRYPGADGMKTGFICTSGFNLVASATRNGRRLIAVVLGAPSSPVRAVKAAKLLEGGFNRSPLAFLSSSLGTVETLQPIAAAPPDLRDQMCGKHRKRPAAESEDVEEAKNGGNALFSLGLGNTKPSALIGPLNRSMEPILVYVGASKTAPENQLATASEAKPKRASKRAKSKAAAAPAAAQTPVIATEPRQNPATVTAPAFAPAAPTSPSTSAFTPAAKPVAPSPTRAPAAKKASKPVATTTTAAAPANQKTKPAAPKAAPQAAAKTSKADAKRAAQPATAQ